MTSPLVRLAVVGSMHLGDRKRVITKIIDGELERLRPDIVIVAGTGAVAQLATQRAERYTIDVDRPASFPSPATELPALIASATHVLRVFADAHPEDNADRMADLAEELGKPVRRVTAI